MEEEKSNTVEIPESLHDRIGARIKGTQFRSVSDYVVLAVREKLARDEEQKASVYSREEEEKIKDRLKALGYL